MDIFSLIFLLVLRDVAKVGSLGTDLDMYEVLFALSKRCRKRSLSLFMN